MKVKGGFDGKEYEFLPDFIAINAYLVTTKANPLIVKMELHLSNADIDSGLLIGTATLRLNKMTFDFGKEVLVAKETRQGFNIKVPIYFNKKLKSITHSPITAKTSLTIPAGHKRLLSISSAHLPKRDVFFKGRSFGKKHNKELIQVPCSPLISTTSWVLVRNFSDAPPPTIAENAIVGHVSKISGKHLASASKVTLSNGRQFFVDSDDNEYFNDPDFA